MQLKARVVLVMVLGIVVLSVGAGCLDNPASDGTETQKRYTIEGTVVDAQTGNPIAHVNIQANNHTTKTGPDGTFKIENLQSPNNTVVAEKSGYLTTHTNVSVDFDSTVRLVLRSEDYYTPNRSELLATHWKQEITCDTCHGSSTVEHISAPPTNETCIECHPLGKIQNQTAAFDPNPHNDPHDIYLDCMSCHRIHQPSVKRCADCHSDGIIPDVP